MMTDEISEFLEKIDSEHFNCVYSYNGMTLMRTEEYNNRMKPLTLEETRLIEEMKARCLAKGQYVDENAKAKFDMLCHLEDFEVQYWELQQENKILKENAENNDKVVDKINWENQLLKKEINKYKYHEDDFKNNSVEINTTKIITPFTDPEHPKIRKTYIISKSGVENYIRHIFGVYDEKGEVDIIWKDN